MAKRLPRVGPRMAGEVRLSPRLRAILQRRARRMARREFRPEIQALRSQKAGIRKARQREIQSIRGATQMAAQAVEGASLKGLKGPYRRDVAQELASRSADIKQSVPFLTSEARAQSAEQMADLRSGILGARVAKQQAAAQNLESLLAGAREEGQSALKHRRSERRSEREGSGEGGLTPTQRRARDRARKNAYITATAFYREDPPKNRREWDALVQAIANETEKADEADAQWAVRKLLQELGISPSGRARRTPTELGQRTR